MSRERSQFLSSSGIAFQIFKTIADEVLAAGGNDDDLRRVLSDKELATKIARVIMDGPQCLKVMVDYGQTLRKMVLAGEYDRVNDDITSKHFPVRGSGRKEVEITLFHFNRLISSGDAIAQMAKAGYRPALAEELLALGVAYKKLQKQFPIVALGSVWRNPDGGRDMPCLDWWDGLGRYLGLGWFEYDWNGRCRFAAVRNAS